MLKVAHILTLFAATLFAGGLTSDRIADWIEATNLPSLDPAVSVLVEDRQGWLLRAYQVENGRWRLPLRTDEVDPFYLEALIRYEDKRFYRHKGVDLTAIARATVQAAANLQVVSGGSTLTMQVARLLERSGTGAWRGKLRQIRVALALEQRLTKTEVLNLYLQLAPMGGNLEGVRAASLAYFGKEPTRLTPAQSSLLVAIPQAPTARQPDKNPDFALSARNRVLSRMLAQGVWTASAIQSAIEEPIAVKRMRFPSHASHLANRVVRGDPLQQEHQLTVDRTLQASLETLASQTAFSIGDGISAAIVVADHKTGEVLASVGSAGTSDVGRDGFVDMTRAVRSPGSTLKPLIYAMGFDDGLAHPETVIEDRPTDFSGYAPKNFDKTFRGPLRVREALQLSLNVPVVAMLDRLGPASLMLHMRQANMAPKLPAAENPGLAVGLGGVGVTLNDLVSLYAGIANGGTSVELVSTTGATRKLATQFLGANAAWYVTDILAGLPSPASSPDFRIAYKTGTSYGYRDAWAIGYDGRHVVGIWVGRPDGAPVPGALGADTAAPLLFKAFSHLKPEPQPFAPPPPSVLLLSNAELPKPLQKFKSRNGLNGQDADAPQIAFPPNGSRLSGDTDNKQPTQIVAKMRRGVPPFTWLANGTPIAIGTYDREITFDVNAGYTSVGVIDALGRSDSTTFEYQ
jgi:penicillin-binding protein 1C